jgi:predicted DNA-binding protein (MmcQ/YjbR family)
MTLEELRHHCLSKPGAEETFPFDLETLVFKVGGKIFLLCSTERNPLAFNIKAKPEQALAMRESYPSVTPGYHMNKTHWNTVELDGSIADSILKSWIDNSYALIVSALPRKTRDVLLAV